MNKLITGAIVMTTAIAANAVELAQEWDKTSALSFINAKLLAYAGEIDSAVMVVHGEKAHSRYFGETAFKMLKGDNKELLIVPGADHTDLYDGGGKDAIPFDRIEAFYRENLQ